MFFLFLIGKIFTIIFNEQSINDFSIYFRALFLCLGGAVYSGGTRPMLEYFHNIGFPCPQLENPLMYYLCLSTVDRR
jgi:hypothetical protein